MKILNPGELEIDLFCKGVKISAEHDPNTEGRGISRTRAGLGSGIELIIPGDIKDIWMNAPVLEHFVKESPYTFIISRGSYFVEDDRTGHRYPVRLPSKPEWYDRKTANGTLMSRVGVLQGTYLGIYINKKCGFWTMDPAMNCKFCSSGLNVGTEEEEDKRIDDVIETARAAKQESGVTFVHFNGGFLPHTEKGDADETGLDASVKYVEAVKNHVGALVGVQVLPQEDTSKYDRVIDAGADHFSFCFEFFNKKVFEEHLPGKAKMITQERFFKAMEYTAAKLGKGRVSGEIIAGIEPIEDTLKAIDYITAMGAFPTICIFRPLKGTVQESLPSPKYEDMHIVFKHMYEACRKNGLPMALAPNIEVSLVVQPDDAKYLVERDFRYYLYEAKLKTARFILQPFFRSKMKARIS